MDEWSFQLFMIFSSFFRVLCFYVGLKNNKNTNNNTELFKALNVIVIFWPNTLKLTFKHFILLFVTSMRLVVIKWQPSVLDVSSLLAWMLYAQL